MNFNDIIWHIYLQADMFALLNFIHRKSVNRNHTYTVLVGQKASSSVQKQEQSSTGRRKIPLLSW